MKAKILYSLLFAIAMTLVATADYSDKQRNTESTAPQILSRAQYVPAENAHPAFLRTQYNIPDTTAFVLR